MSARLQVGALALVWVVFAGCADTTSVPTTNETGGSTLERVRLHADCEVGCTDPDPSPTAPGFWFGTAMTGTQCVNGTQTDADVDQLSDFCEKNLANAFAPSLRYTGSDQLGGEPHWVAKRLGTSGTKARIAYLLSYYNDLGPDGDVACGTNLPAIYDREVCQGHAGDSEVIVLDVGYNASTQHWVLDSALLSAHADYNPVHKNTVKGYALPLTYEGVVGGRPYVYVSYQKHANYASDADCDSGAIFGSDNCVPDSILRVVAGANLNLGSRAHQFLNCMASSNPIYSGSGRSECYWTDTQKFSGWHVGNPTATPYSPILTGIGF